MMPFTPFLSDLIYTNLTGEVRFILPTGQSHTQVHHKKKLLDQMKVVRDICELGHSKKKTRKYSS